MASESEKEKLAHEEANTNTDEPSSQIVTEEPAKSNGTSAPLTNDAPRDGVKQDVSADAEEADVKKKAKEDAAKKKAKAAKLGQLLLLAKQSIKAALAPTIAIAILQSSVVASYFGTVGYLIPISTVFSVPMLPRARFLQGLAINLVLISLSCAVNLLAMWSSIEARTHTAVPGATPSAPGLPPYNSSQSAVAAIWLFVQVWAINAARARWPNLTLPTVVYVIITSSSLSSVVVMTNVSQAEALIRQLLVAMLSAFGLSMAVSLLIFPLSCRTMAFGKAAQLMGALKGALKAQDAFIRSVKLESKDGDHVGGHGESAEENGKEKDGGGKDKKQKRKDKNGGSLWDSADASPEAQALRTASQAAIQSFGSLNADMEVAQTEMFWGKLHSSDLTDLLALMRDCLIPISGMQSIIGISIRATDEQKEQQIEGLWADAVTQLKEPVALLTSIVVDGLDHAGIVLEIIPRPKKATGTKEAEAEPVNDVPMPGDAHFVQTIEAHLESLHTQTRQIARSLSEALVEVQHSFDHGASEGDEDRPQTLLYLLLHLDTLMQATGQAVLALARFADSKVADGTMSHNRLVVPNWLMLRKFFGKILSRDENQVDQGEDTGVGAPTTVAITYLGDSFIRDRDPEHTAPTTTWQRLGAAISSLWHIVGSAESAHGLRAACAVMSVGIINYLEPTQHFFLQNRLVWAESIIILGMATSTGANLFGLILRVAGTALGMVVALLSWYIPNQHMPGIIVIQFVLILAIYVCVMLFPSLIQGFFISIVTTVMITGYELEILVLGPVFAASALQEYLPIYELAPYRLATVAAGCLVAFFWTVFPYPVTERRIIRMELARGLYLLAEACGVSQSAIGMRVKGRIGLHDAGSEEALLKLNVIREELFQKMAILLPNLRQHVDFQKWEPVIGGPWPADTYQRIIRRATRIFSCLSLATYISFHAPELTEQEKARWQEVSIALLRQMNATMHAVTSTLASVSNSLHSGRSLPPFTPVPKAKELESIFRLLPDAKLLADEGDDQLPAYAAFAVREVCLHFVCCDLRDIVEDVGKLVGTVDFSMGFNIDVEAEAGAMGIRK